MWWGGCILGKLVREGLSCRVTLVGGQNEVNSPTCRASVAGVLQAEELQVQRP